MHRISVAVLGLVALMFVGVSVVRADHISPAPLGSTIDLAAIHLARHGTVLALTALNDYLSRSRGLFDKRKTTLTQTQYTDA